MLTVAKKLFGGCIRHYQGRSCLPLHENRPRYKAFPSGRGAHQGPSVSFDSCFEINELASREKENKIKRRIKHFQKDLNQPTLAGLRKLLLRLGGIDEDTSDEKILKMNDLDLRGCDILNEELRILSLLIIKMLSLSSMQISALSKLENLYRLNVFNTQVSEEQVQELKKSLPGCKVEIKRENE